MKRFIIYADTGFDHYFIKSFKTKKVAQAYLNHQKKESFSIDYGITSINSGYGKLLLEKESRSKSEKHDCGITPFMKFQKIRKI